MITPSLPTAALSKAVARVTNASELWHVSWPLSCFHLSLKMTCVLSSLHEDREDRNVPGSGCSSLFVCPIRFFSLLTSQGVRSVSEALDIASYCNPASVWGEREATSDHKELWLLDTSSGWDTVTLSCLEALRLVLEYWILNLLRKHSRRYKNHMLKEVLYLVAQWLRSWEQTSYVKLAPSLFTASCEPRICQRTEAFRGRINSRQSAS